MAGPILECKEGILLFPSCLRRQRGTSGAYPGHPDGGVCAI